MRNPLLAMRTGGLFVALLLGTSLPIQAQNGTGTQEFPAEYFAPSRPADAYDMVRKLPGFELIEVDDEVRGFTGSRGNVLFDGRAPSGKQESLEQMLRRIPATAVLRIELIRGGSMSAATGGFDLVANVVRRPQAAMSGSILAGASAADEIGAKPDGRLEFSRQSGSSHLDAAIALETEIDDDSGAGGIIERDATGVVEDRVDRDEREYLRTLSSSAEYKLPIGSGELIANLNAARERTIERVRSIEDQATVEATERENIWNGEISAQHQVPMWNGKIESLIVHRAEWLKAMAEEEDEQFSENTETHETVARAEYRQTEGPLQFFGSAEAAFNGLSSDAELTEGGVLVPITGTDVHVTERRGEAAIGATWQAAKMIVVEPSIRAEYSQIRSTGDSSQDDDFIFWKPRLRVSWNRGQTRVQATIEREAAQLDFGDFVASAELDRDDVVAGASSLRPPTTWSFATVLEQRFWEGGALVVTFRRERIDDVIDRVVVEDEGELFDAVGNIGPGKRTSLRAELTVPLDRAGLSGMEVRTDLVFLRSRVTDPVTGQKRTISEDRPFEGEIRLTHDLPGGRWSWGVEASLAHEEREFRFDELRRERKGTALSAHIEFRPGRDWRLRGEVENFTSRTLNDERQEFDGLRSSGVLDSIEVRKIETSPIWTVSLRKSFGAAASN
jgi:hypothetical protein